VDESIRPVSLGESNEVFEKLFLAAVSPGASDWNHTNEHRHQLRAQWARFFQSYDVVLTPVSPVPAIRHDLDGDVTTITITVNGAARPYTDQSIWTGWPAPRTCPRRWPRSDTRRTDCRSACR
jgi:amidase